MDSAKASVTQNLPQGDVYLGEVRLDQPQEEKDGLWRFGGRKFIVGMTLILIASLFTGMSMMTVEQWLWFTSGVGVTYFGVNFIQKKMI